MNRLSSIQLTFFFLLFLSLSSCTKYLEEKSDTSLAIPTTLTDFQAMLDNTLRMNLQTPTRGEASSDDYYLPVARYNALSDGPRALYTWQPFDYNYENDWSRGYVPVYPCNLILERLDDVSITVENKERWDNVKGSALFYRAYAFLNLVWIYGKAYEESNSATDLGIALRLGSNPNDPSKRSTVKESYEKIVSDLKISIPHLPLFPQNTMRPSKVAAYGLLARTYLSMRDYSEALKYSDSCLQFQSYLMNYNGDPGILNLSGNTPFNHYTKNGEIIFYSEPNRLIGIFSLGTGVVDTLLQQSYSTSDRRRTGFLRNIGGANGFKGNYSGSGSINFSGIATDEMYLVRAECKARLGDKDAAMGDLNTLLVKRWATGSFVPLTAVDNNDAINKILLERRKELLFRGLRWIDIKRLNVEGRNIILKRKLPDGTIVSIAPNSNYYALPLPKDLIDLTGMPQNPG